MITGDQLTLILITVLPILIGVLADGRTTRRLLKDITHRQDKADTRLHAHLTDHRAHRRGWRPKP